MGIKMELKKMRKSIRRKKSKKGDRAWKKW